MMTYDDAVELIGELHRGSNTPSNLELVMKLVLGKMARRRINTAKRTAEITVGGNTEFLLSTYIPDFIDFKTDAENKNRGPFFYQDTSPCYLRVTNKTRFTQGLEGGYCMVEDGTLIISIPAGSTSPETLYVPIWSKYLVLDEDGGILKEKPTKGGDTFIFDSIFDDVFIDGVLLYLDRRDMDDKEFVKSKSQWEKTLNELSFYQ